MAASMRLANATSPHFRMQPGNDSKTWTTPTRITPTLHATSSGGDDGDHA